MKIKYTKDILLLEAQKILERPLSYLVLTQE